MPSADSKPGQLQSAPSTNSSCMFKPPSSPGKLDGLGLNPIRKVRARPTSMKQRKPSALDKHWRHVALIQSRNRQQATQLHQQQLQQQRKRQNFAQFNHQLRTLILAGDTEAVQQTWQPAAAAAARLQDTQVAEPGQAEQPKESNTLAAAAAAGAGGCSSSSTSSSGSRPCVAPAALSRSISANDAAADETDDVDHFLDGLLQQAAAKKAGSSRRGSKPAPYTTPAAAAGRHSRPGSAHGKQQQQQKCKAKPAWALTEQQQAELDQTHLQEARLSDSAQLTEEAEEAELLDFAEQLSWEALVGQLGDEQLAAAFEELGGAAQQAAAGDPAADKTWRRCFVAAINHAAMKDIAAAAAAGQGSSCVYEQDRQSDCSSAGHAQRAEAVAARRQKLLDRLSRLGGTAAAGLRSVRGSLRADARSQLGEQSSVAAAAAAAAGDEWDRSTRAGGNDVSQLQGALQTLQAGEVLVENPEMKTVHSVASVRSMLQKMIIS